MYLGILLDGSRVSFGIVLSLVAFVAYRYRADYLANDKVHTYFYFRLAWFTGRILLLIVSRNVFLTFLAWDGLGLSSFLLVCFYEKAPSRGGGMVTLLTNRLGDGFLCVGVGRLLFCGGWGGSHRVGSWVGVLFLLAAFSKSAQWPLCA